MTGATRLTVATFGVLAAIAGIEHGIGEALQGSVAPADMSSFPSWPNSEFFRVLGGEPAMTVVPNLLVTGILAMLASLALLIWATAFVQRRLGWLVLILLSVVILLVGGGFGPPILGVLIGLTAIKIGSPLRWWRAHLSPGTRVGLGKVWPWSFAACLVAWLMLLTGLPLLGYLSGAEASSPTFLALLLATIVAAFVLLVVTALLGLARDARELPSPQPRLARRIA